MTVHRTIDTQHPFYDESLQFYLLNLATFAVGLHFETQEGCVSSCRHREHSFVTPALNSNQKVDVTIENREWELPDFPPLICWQDPASNEDCYLRVSQSLVDYLRSGTNKPDELQCELTPTHRIRSQS